LLITDVRREFGSEGTRTQTREEEERHVALPNASTQRCPATQADAAGQSKLG